MKKFFCVVAGFLEREKRTNDAVDAFLRHAEGLVKLGHLLDDVGILKHNGREQQRSAVTQWRKT